MKLSITVVFARLCHEEIVIYSHFDVPGGGKGDSLCCMDKLNSPKVK